MTKSFKGKFGTDGIRGRVGEAPITVDFILKLGWAAGRVLAKDKGSRVVIGKDTRISGYMFESALEAGLSAAGVDVCLLGPMPTPGIAYLTRELKADAGIVISASHNPYTDNGFKFFNGQGEKLDSETEKQIEQHLAIPLVTVAPDKLGKATRIENAREQYVDFCRQQFADLSLHDFRIIIDCANGANYHIAPQLFAKFGAQVETLGVSPNGLNINDYCGSTHTTNLQQAVVKQKADLGIAFDGDADRVIMVDHQGEVVDGDQLVYIMAKYGAETKTIRHGIVGTQMSNLGLEQAVKAMGLEFVRTKVGDKYVLAALQEQGWQLGGESSGHIIQMQRNSTGDATLAALQVLQALQYWKISLHEALQPLTMHPQVMINVPVKCSQDPLEVPQIIEAIKKLEEKMNGDGRVLLRRSGTEQVVRVMVEGCDNKQVRHDATALASVVKEHLTHEAVQ
jgi:phosphoglucosamine mutase